MTVRKLHATKEVNILCTTDYLILVNEKLMLLHSPRYETFYSYFILSTRHVCILSMCTLDLKYPDDSIDSQSPNASKMTHCS